MKYAFSRRRGFGFFTTPSFQAVKQINRVLLVLVNPTPRYIFSFIPVKNSRPINPLFSNLYFRHEIKTRYILVYLVELKTKMRTNAGFNLETIVNWCYHSDQRETSIAHKINTSNVKSVLLNRKTTKYWLYQIIKLIILINNKNELYVDIWLLEKPLKSFKKIEAYEQKL